MVRRGTILYLALQTDYAVMALRIISLDTPPNICLPTLRCLLSYLFNILALRFVICVVCFLAFPLLLANVHIAVLSLTYY